MLLPCRSSQTALVFSALRIKSTSRFHEHSVGTSSQDIGVCYLPYDHQGEYRTTSSYVVVEMPLAKPKPSEIAAEAKKTYIPYIEQKFPQYPVRSVLHLDSCTLRIGPKQSTETRLRVAVIDGDPVDVALDWYEYNVKNPAKTINSSVPAVTRIPVVNMANEKRPGGDWESGLMAPEENFCRRSNLVHALNTPWDPYPAYEHYPIPTKGGIYSPYVGKVKCLLISPSHKADRSSSRIPLWTRPLSDLEGLQGDTGNFCSPGAATEAG